MYCDELWRVVPPNGVYELMKCNDKQNFSLFETETINRIMHEIKYIMDRITFDSNGRFIGSFGSYVKLEYKAKSLFIYFRQNFMSFTKLEDDYIMIVFGRDNTYVEHLSEQFRIRTSDREYDVRFGVICDDLPGVKNFYSEQMLKDNFIQKIMLGEKI